MYRSLLSALADLCRRHPAIAAVAATAIMLLVPAALTPFNTKGEPREAIVALSMLMSGDWILPVSFGADMPYKPPFLAWMIAIMSLPASHVSEFTARLPSVVACMCLAATVASFVRRDMNFSGGRALSVAIITVTSVEVWRSGGACRVDMVLTAAITGACVLLYRLALQGGIRHFAGAVALMTVAVLTKGPVGMVLPCLIIAVWAMMGRLGTRRFITLAGLVFCAAILSLLIPAWWYAEAYSRGGQRFLDLAIEENFGRMTGTMSYASHLNPWWYNIQSLAAGLLPYTIVFLLSLFAIKLSVKRSAMMPGRAARLAVAACAVTLVFYTIPASKRSVYLLPMYPFLSIAILLTWEWLACRSCKLAGLFSGLMSSLGVMMAIALVSAPFQPWIPGMSVWSCWPCAVMVGAAVFAGRRIARLPATLGAIVAIYTAVGIAVLPPVMESKTDRDLALSVESIVPEGEPVWELITHDPLLRYYTAGFYLADRIRLMPPTGPESDGWLLASPDDAASFAAANPDMTLSLHWQKARSCDSRRPVAIYRLSRN